MLSLQIGWFRCEACHKLRWIGNRAWRSAYERGFGVCRECYEAWNHVGRRCPRCWAQVQPTQSPGFFPQWGRFGHFECGAAFLA